MELPLARRDRLRRALFGLTGTAGGLPHRRAGDGGVLRAVPWPPGGDASQAARWLGADIRKHLNRRRETLAASHLTPARLAALLEHARAAEHGERQDRQAGAGQTVLAAGPRPAGDRGPGGRPAPGHRRRLRCNRFWTGSLADNPRVGGADRRRRPQAGGFSRGPGDAPYRAAVPSPTRCTRLIEALYAQQAAEAHEWRVPAGRGLARRRTPNGSWRGELGQHTSAPAVLLRGWVHRLRDLGGVCFLLLRDRSGHVPGGVRAALPPTAAGNPLTLESVVEVARRGGGQRQGARRLRGAGRVP